ncbi:MAG: hypothetical protein VX466_08060 [Myxococcota bacterium]|nr:hypothetical protein [Myxococcota bacterium]MEE2673732.1 hypothetical protein [Myxococcota bacterium]
MKEISRNEQVWTLLGGLRASDGAASIAAGRASPSQGEGYEHDTRNPE